eukprot:scaffold2002_cov96-Isochrysis_galbana.AAC.2
MLRRTLTPPAAAPRERRAALGACSCGETAPQLRPCHRSHRRSRAPRGAPRAAPSRRRRRSSRVGVDAGAGPARPRARPPHRRRAAKPRRGAMRPARPQSKAVGTAPALPTSAARAVASAACTTSSSASACAGGRNGSAAPSARRRTTPAAGSMARLAWPPRSADGCASTIRARRWASSSARGGSSCTRTNSACNLVEGTVSWAGGARMRAARSAASTSASSGPSRVKGSRSLTSSRIALVGAGGRTAGVTTAADPMDQADQPRRSAGRTRKRQPGGGQRTALMCRPVPVGSTRALAGRGDQAPSPVRSSRDSMQRGHRLHAHTPHAGASAAVAAARGPAPASTPGGQPGGEPSVPPTMAAAIASGWHRPWQPRKDASLYTSTYASRGGPDPAASPRPDPDHPPNARGTHSASLGGSSNRSRRPGAAAPEAGTPKPSGPHWRSSTSRCATAAAATACTHSMVAQSPGG